MAKEDSCYQCPDRSPGCWDHCKEYKERTKKREEEKKKYRRERDIDISLRKIRDGRFR